MKALREQNIVHRDLKPGNILIKKDPVTGKMKVLRVISVLWAVPIVTWGFSVALLNCRSNWLTLGLPDTSLRKAQRNPLTCTPWLGLLSSWWVAGGRERERERE